MECGRFLKWFDLFFITFLKCDTFCLIWITFEDIIIVDVLVKSVFMKWFPSFFFILILLIRFKYWSIIDLFFLVFYNIFILRPLHYNYFTKLFSNDLVWGLFWYLMLWVFYLEHVRLVLPYVIFKKDIFYFIAVLAVYIFWLALFLV